MLMLLQNIYFRLSPTAQPFSSFISPLVEENFQTFKEVVALTVHCNIATTSFCSTDIEDVSACTSSQTNTTRYISEQVLSQLRFFHTECFLHHIAYILQNVCFPLLQKICDCRKPIVSADFNLCDQFRIKQGQGKLKRWIGSAV